jgi:hypothetical protein
VRIGRSRRSCSKFPSKQKRFDFDVDEMAAELARKASNISAARLAISSRLPRARWKRAFETGKTDQIVEARRPAGSSRACSKFRRDLVKIWSQIQLKPDVKQSILSKVRMFNTGDKAPRGLFYKVCRTGKTGSRADCRVYQHAFESLSIASLKAGILGRVANS